MGAAVGSDGSKLACQIEHSASFPLERGATLRFAEAARDYFLGDLFERRARFVIRSVIEVHGKFLLFEGKSCGALCLDRAHC
jgi:hypothetical protein